MIIVSDKYAYQKAELIFPSILLIQLPNDYLERVVNKACLLRKKECQKPFEKILIIAEPIREKISNVINHKEIESIDLFFTKKRDTPKTKSIFAIFDPNIPPIAISGFPFSKARIVTKSSGKEVPNPNIKIPIIKGGT